MSTRSVSLPLRSGAYRFPPALGRAHAVPAAPPALPVGRVPRAPSLVEIAVPPLAVWAGEVVFIVGVPDAVALGAVRALHTAARGRIWAAAVAPSASPDAVARALAVRASRTSAVVAAVQAVAGVRPAHAVEALRRAVAHLVPCRCVWVAPDPAPGDASARLLPRLEGL